MILFGIFGIICVFLGGYWLISDWLFFRRAIRIPGVVVAYDEKEGYARKPGAERPPLYAPIVMFELDGEARKITGTTYSPSKSPQLGMRCTVGIDPRNIDNARIYFRKNFVIAIVFFVIGCAMLMGAVISFNMRFLG